MRKALAILLLTLATSLPALALWPATAEAAVTPTRAERRVLGAINIVRAAHDLAPLRFRPSLVRAARAHARDMAGRDVLTHLSDNGWTVGTRVRYFGYTTDGCTFWKAGENIACAQVGSGFATSRAIVSLWMDSPDHREVLLTRSFRDIGVGIRLSGDGWRYFTVDLGRRID